MTPDECKNLDELIATLVKYHPEANVELVEKAYHFAEKAHAGQLRKSGEPYFVHPLTVAGILAKLVDRRRKVSGTSCCDRLCKRQCKRNRRIAFL